MLLQKVFGDFDPNIEYLDRPAVYAVVLSAVDNVAVVKGKGRYFLPGGGLNNDETEEQALTREIREEIARDLRIISEIGRATQYFYADADNCNYKMDAVFFLATLKDEMLDNPESELNWLSPADASQLFYHQCHAWAINQVCRWHVNEWPPAIHLRFRARPPMCINSALPSFPVISANVVGAAAPFGVIEKK